MLLQVAIEAASESYRALLDKVDARFQAVSMSLWSFGRVRVLGSQESVFSWITRL